MRILLLIVFILLSILGARSASAQTPEIGASGLSLPRFVSLLHKRANVRSGPGTHYPRLWEYRRPTLPLEIVQEYGRWRRVRDVQGDEGWMHKRLLTAKRTILLRPSTTSHALKRTPHAQAGIIAFVQAGVIAHLLRCESGWCAIHIKDKEGWLTADALWGVYDFEAEQFNSDE